MWRCSNNILFSVTSKTELLQLHAAQCEQLREMGIIYIHVLFCRLLTLTFVMRSQVRFSSHHSFTLPCWCSLFGLSSQQMCCSSKLFSHWLQKSGRSEQQQRRNEGIVIDSVQGGGQSRRWFLLLNMRSQPELHVCCWYNNQLFWPKLQSFFELKYVLSSGIKWIKQMKNFWVTFIYKVGTSDLSSLPGWRTSFYS